MKLRASALPTHVAVIALTLIGIVPTLLAVGGWLGLLAVAVRRRAGPLCARPAGGDPPARLNPRLCPGRHGGHPDERPDHLVRIGVPRKQPIE